jgi:hypothetical protein
MSGHGSTLVLLTFMVSPTSIALAGSIAPKWLLSTSVDTPQGKARTE